MEIKHVKSAIEPVAGNWYRLILSFRTGTNAITEASTRLYLESPTAGNYIYACGAQLEVGQESTSLILTESSQQLRAADSLLSTSDILDYNNASIYHDMPVYRSINLSSPVITKGAHRFISLSPSMTPQAFLNGIYIPLGGPSAQLSKLAISYGPNGVKAKSDKITLYSDSIAPTVVSGFPIKYDPNAIMHIRAIATFSRVLTDSELINLTVV